MALDPFQHRVQLFTGKGGVGKSSVVAAVALAAAEAGHRPLVVELGHRATMETLFEAPAIGYEPTPVGDGVAALNMELDEALTDYIAAQVRVRGVAKRVIANETLRRFFYAAPAVAEVVTLRKLAELAEGGAHHPILVDLDATGHARMFLSLPQVFEGLVGPTGPLRALLDATTALLRDRERTALHLVTLPAPLPTRETLEFHAHLAAGPPVGLGYLVVNRVPAPPLGDAERALLPELARREGFAADVALAERALAQHSLARRCIDDLGAGIPLPRVELPELGTLRRAPSRAALGALGAALVSQLAEGAA